MNRDRGPASDFPVFGQVDPLLFGPARDPEGRVWIAGLPDLVETICRRWELELDSGPMRHGYSSVVISVRRGSALHALKITWPPQAILDEAHALRSWNGEGTVLLYEADVDTGALLLERLDPDHRLSSLPLTEALAVAGRLLRRLAIPAPPGFRDVRVLVGATVRSLEAQRAQLNGPVPPEWLQEAIEFGRHLETHAGNDLLIHADLHYDNILPGTREPWLAIDPKAMAGEPERAVAELLWTSNAVLESDEAIRRMLATLVESAELHAERARQWAIVRCTDYWLWGIEHGLTEDPERCRRILGALLARMD